MLEKRTFLYTTSQNLKEKCTELGYSKNQFYSWFNDRVHRDDCYISYEVCDEDSMIDKALIAMGAKLDDEILIEICW